MEPTMVMEVAAPVTSYIYYIGVCGGCVCKSYEVPGLGQADIKQKTPTTTIITTRRRRGLGENNKRVEFESPTCFSDGLELMEAA